LPQLHGQTINDIGKSFIKNYLPSEYGSNPQTWAAIQDNDGIMYFGNNDGILEFDGKTWRKIIGPVDIRAFFKDSTGIIYVGAQNEIGYLEKDELGYTKFRSFTEQLSEKKKNFYNIPSIVKYKEGVLFIGFSHMFYFKDKKLEKFWESEKDFSFGFNIDERIFVRKKEVGLMELVNDSLQLIPNGNRFSEQAVYTMLKYDENRILIGTRNQGLFFMNINNYSITTFKTNIDDYIIKHNLYHGIKIYEKYFVLVTSSGGAVVIDKKGRLIQLYNKYSGLDNNNTHFAYLDYGENLWITSNNGISYIETYSPISFFDNESGYSNIPTIVNKYGLNYYLGTLQNFYTLDIDTILTESSNNFYSFNPLHKESTSFMDIKIIDNELYSVFRNGIYKLENSKLKLVFSFKVSYLLHQLISKPNYLLLGTSKGLVLIKKENDKFIDLGMIKNISEEVRVIIEDKNGDIWFNTLEKNIYKLKLFPEKQESEVIQYDILKGLKIERPAVPILLNDTIYVTTKNNVFQYDFNNDLFHKCNSFPLTIGDNDSIKYESFTQLNDKIIFTTTASDGIGMLTKNENGEFTVNFTPFLREPAFPVFHTFIDTVNKWFWYTSTKKIYIYNYQYEKDYENNYKTLMRKITINNDSVISYGKYDNNNVPIFKFSENTLCFEFSAIQFENNDAIMYSYFIENFDKTWSKWSNDSKVKYTNIPNGDFTFKVKAINCYGIESEIAEYKFSILPPWHKTFWAYLLYLVLLIILIYGIVYLNSKRLKAINIKLEKIIDERTFEINQKNAELNKRNKLITDSIRYAKHIQEAVLPNAHILNKYFPESFIYFLPRDIVSGDFYWFSQQDNKLFIATGDCTGHGVPGALMSIMGNTLLNEIVNEKKIHKPSEIFDQLNKRIVALLKQNEEDNQTRDDGMDISLCCFDKKNKTIQIASANHKVLVINNGGTDIIEGDIYSIGGLFSNKSDFGFTNYELEYRPNTKIYLYSDGYQDQFGGKYNKKFMAKKFEQLILNNVHLTMNEQYNTIKSTFEEWKKDVKQIDDILVIGIKI